MRNATNLRGFVPGFTDAIPTAPVSSCLNWPPYRKQPLRDASNSPSPPTAAFERDEGLCSDPVQLCGRCTCTLPIGVRRYSSTANQQYSNLRACFALVDGACACARGKHSPPPLCLRWPRCDARRSTGLSVRTFRKRSSYTRPRAWCCSAWPGRSAPPGSRQHTRSDSSFAAQWRARKRRSRPFCTA